jgi:hypothetical protein
LLFSALGWPLLIDLMQVLRMGAPAWLTTKKTQVVVAVVAVLAALAQSFAAGAQQSSSDGRRSTAGEAFSSLDQLVPCGPSLAVRRANKVSSHYRELC